MTFDEKQKEENNRKSDIQDLYYSWLIIPLRVTKQTKSNTFFLKERQHELKLEDLTVRARSIFGQDETAIGGVWRITSEEVLEALALPAESYQFTVKNTEYREDPVTFSFCTSWVFCFYSGTAFFCLGISANDPMAGYMISDFGFLEQNAEISQGEMRIELRERLSQWIQNKMGYVSFFYNDSDYQKYINAFFVDVCIYNIGLQKERFADILQVKEAVHNLHLGLRTDDPRKDPSEEDIEFVYSTKNLAVDAPGHPGMGSYRWGCCITSQTMNYYYGGVDGTKLSGENLETKIDELLMEGLPLMILALQQRYRCFELTDRMNEFSELSTAELEELRDEMTHFIAYGTLSASSISRWYNVKQTYGHLIRLLDTEEAVADVTKKLDMLIRDADRRSQDVIERTNNIISLFGLIAIPASLIELISIAVSSEALWARGISILCVPMCIALMFIWRKKK